MMPTLRFFGLHLLLVVNYQELLSHEAKKLNRYREGFLLFDCCKQTYGFYLELTITVGGMGRGAVRRCPVTLCKHILSVECLKYTYDNHNLYRCYGQCF